MFRRQRKPFHRPPISAKPIRRPPLGDLAAPVLGYVSPIDSAELKEPAYKGYLPEDEVGQSGVEATYYRPNVTSRQEPPVSEGAMKATRDRSGGE